MFSLFMVAFIAATIWPMASEAYVSYLITDTPSLFVEIWVVASIANTLGSITMYELAKFSTKWLEKKKLRIGHRWVKLQASLQRYGAPILAFAWLPIIGDILPLVAGALNFQRIKVYCWLLLGKAVRYGVVIWGTLSVLQAIQSNN
ncbi:YqaA family protein [Reinekea sp.]|jgi:membrane protein YqaA with SNARE-associated domain|uniref:YqaA family protein n=1 Tax=Reinekea sp. TaxID=1970455 RepID=UPI00398961A4